MSDISRQKEYDSYLNSVVSVQSKDNCYRLEKGEISGLEYDATNFWIASLTSNKFPDLLPPGSIENICAKEVERYFESKSI